MLDDPDSLGVALVSHFLLVMTQNSGVKNRKQYSAEKALDLMKERRLQSNVLR